jgi:Family of unknown function (DUF6338)
MLPSMGGDSSRAIAAFALAAIPGVIVLEILEYARPRTRERSGARAFAGYLIISLLVWVAAVLCLDADGRLAAVIDSAKESGSAQVACYVALAWRLLLASVVVGLSMRLLSGAFSRLAFRVEERTRLGRPRHLRLLGDLLVRFVAMAFAWDRLLERLRRIAKPQIVHVRFRDGTDLYGVLAAGGRADFQADGGGLVLDAELVERDGELMLVPGSSGVFISADAVASVAFVEFESPTAGEVPSDHGG